MKVKHYVAIDIGASSGRLILGKIEAEKLVFEEIHRFKNGFSCRDGHDRWEIDRLIEEVFKGLEKVKKKGIHSCVVGIDTWGVDYVLIGKNGKKLADPISYRDSRTINKINELTSEYPKSYIYQKTGIQFLELNTLYQLYVEDQNLIKEADKILLIPDYIGYVLTGKMVAETTNSSTTQMLNLREQIFDKDLLAHLNIDALKFAPLVDAGTPLGKVKADWQKVFDLPDCEVITVATHDTASAVIGTPAEGDNWAFLSSGTWSLLGTEMHTPITKEAAFAENYTNEWGAYGTYRFLKNIMGLWIIQEIARLFDYRYSFQQIADLAAKEVFFKQVIDVNDKRFNNPDNMVTEIQNYCRETNQIIPETIGELANCVYGSLALLYAKELKKMAKITGKAITKIHIVGGGSNVAILNQLTANLTGVHVYAGPGEATAIGNLCVQMITTKELENVVAARDLIRESFPITLYKPQEMPELSALRERKILI